MRAIYMATRPRGFALVLVPVYFIKHKTLGLMLYLLHTSTYMTCTSFKELLTTWCATLLVWESCTLAASAILVISVALGFSG